MSCCTSAPCRFSPSLSRRRFPLARRPGTSQLRTVGASARGCSVLAQRLLRRVCPACARPTHVSAQECPKNLVIPESEHVLEAEGCRECRRTGYQGRVGIYELLQFNDTTRELVMEQAPAGRIVAEAVASETINLLQTEALALVSDHITTIQEAMRVCRG